jgi:hypothetical protein
MMHLDLRALLKRGLYLLVAVAFLSLWTGDAFAWPVALLFTSLAAASWFWEPSPARFQSLNRAWTALTVLVLAAGAYLLAFTDLGFVQLGVYLILYLTTAKLFQRERLADHIQLLALSFLLIAAATAYNEDILFALFFATYVVVGVVTFSIYHLCQQLEENEARGGRRVRQLFGAQFLSVLSAMALISFLSAVLFFFLFPRLGFGFFAQQSRESLQLSGFSENVDLGSHGAIKDDNTIVMRVQFPEGRPADTSALYWRGTSLDHYDGVGWRRRLRRKKLPLLANNDWQFSVQNAPPLGPLLQQDIYLEPITGTNILFALQPLHRVGFADKDKHVPSWLKDRSMHIDESGALRNLAPSTTGYQYRAISDTGRPQPADLRRLSRDDLHKLPSLDAYTQLPTLSPRVRDLALQITRDADNDHDRVLAIAEHLRQNYTYTTDLPDPGAEPPVEAFLFTHKRGHCEYFATTMTLLVRAIGIPARITNGFLGGSWNDFDDFLAVRNADAHSWVEVYMGPHGWIPFDPTPSDANVSNRTSWTDSFTNAYDSLRFKWLKYVIEYNLETQVELVRQAAASITGDEDALDTAQTRVTLTEIFFSLRRNWPPALLVILISVIGYLGIRIRGWTPLDRRDALWAALTLAASITLVWWRWKPSAGSLALAYAALTPTLALLWGALWRRFSRAQPQQRTQGISELYRQLREHLATTAIPDARQLGPEALLHRAQQAQLPALDDLQHLIRRYLDVRFGAADLHPNELRDLKRTLRRASRALRAHHNP